MLIATKRHQDIRRLSINRQLPQVRQLGPPPQRVLEWTISAGRRQREVQECLGQVPEGQNIKIEDHINHIKEDESDDDDEF